MDVKVVGQPTRKRVEKDNVVHFTGTLVDTIPIRLFSCTERPKMKEEDIPKRRGPEEASAEPQRESRRQNELISPSPK